MMRSSTLPFRCLITAAFVLLLTVAQAQTNVGVNTATPNASAALMVDTASTGPQGMLVPRMTQARRNAIASPATGLMIFQTDNTPGFYYFDGTTWTAVGGTGGATTQLIVRKTNATQLLNLANGVNQGDVVTFENLVISPTIGSYNTTTSTYTVGAGAAGLYLISFRFNVVDNGTNTLAVWNYAEVNGTAISTNNSYTTYVSSAGGGSNLPSGLRGQGGNLHLLSLNAGDAIRIRALGFNSSVSTTLNNNGGTILTIVKLN